MSLHNKILSYMIENLGLPLMGAVGHVQKKSSTPEKDAEMMAKLLTSSVDLGMAISAKMNVPTDAVKAEALRFQLTALAANALSERARLKSKEPADADLDSLKASVDSMIAFSENFSVNEQGVEYLEKAGVQDFMAKEFEELSTIDAFLPVIAVMDHKDRGLFPNIAERLIKEADDLAGQFKTDSGKPEETAVFIKQKVLKLLVQTFAQIYPDVIGDSKPIGDVWQAFDRQKALIILLMDYLLTGQKNIETAEEGAGTAQPSAEAPPAAAPQAPPAAPPPAEEAAQPPMPEQKETKDEEGSGDGSSNGPMGFFKK